MKDNEAAKIEQIMKQARTVDPEHVTIDPKLKEALKDKLYEQYLSNLTHTSHMSLLRKIKAMPRSMKFISIAMMAIILLGGGIFAYYRFGNDLIPTQDNPNTRLFADLAVVEGTVEVRRNGATNWTTAAQGNTLAQGDSIKTGDNSKAVLMLDNGDAVRLNAQTEINLESTVASNIIITQAQGETYARVTKSDTNSFTIKDSDIQAKALGTAYSFKSDPTNSQVQVSVYASNVEVTAAENQEEVAELEKAVISTTDKKITISELTEEEYKANFVAWNLQQDKSGGYEVPVEGAPIVTISAPANGTTTQEGSINVTGTVTAANQLKKIVANGTIYTSMDYVGKGFNPATGAFNIDIALNDGANTISIVAYDIYWNASAAAEVSVTKEVPAPDPVDPSENYSFSVTGISSPAAGKIYVTWEVIGYGAGYGFKVVRSADSVPVYPGNDYLYISDAGARDALWTGVPAGTYNVRVCIYNGSGGCALYTSNYVSITVEGEGGGGGEYPSGVSLSVTDPIADGSGKYQVTLNWATVGGEAPNGFKVCYADHAVPTYPADNCTYVGSGTTSFTISGLVPGATYHFRVGVYKISGGGCELYSNDVAKTMPS